MYIAAIGLTLLAIIVFVLLVQSEIEIRKKKKDEIIDTTYYFTFTEEQKCRIKKSSINSTILRFVIYAIVMEGFREVQILHLLSKVVLVEKTLNT